MLSNIVNFIKENYMFVIELVVLVFSLLFNLFRKRVKITDSNLVSIVKFLPGLIWQAELTYKDPKSGKDKFQFVFDACMKFLQSNTDSSLDDVISRYGETISSLIEDMLSTPKKGGSKNA